MAYINRVERILGTVCFQCCAKPVFPGIPSSITRKDNHPELGEKVNTNGACAGCPVGKIRGDGAPITRGQKDRFFGHLIPGPGCERELTEEMTWKPCEKCAHATVINHHRKKVLTLNDIDYCIANCRLKEIRDGLVEIYMEGVSG